MGETYGLRVLVTGGRDFQDRAAMDRALSIIANSVGISAVIHGAYRGADTLAGEWARAHGIAEDPVPADWATFGRRAGPIRNAAMIRHHDPHLVVAFSGGDGTLDCVTQAEEAGIGVVLAAQLIAANCLPPTVASRVDSRT